MSSAERSPEAMRAELSAGRQVLTNDGHRLGSIKEVQGSYMKIDARLKRDYWLCCDDVQAVDEDSLILAFPDRELGDHKLKAPAMNPEDDPLRDVNLRPVIDDEDHRMQREIMEREMARQSARLDPSVLHPQHEVPGAAPVDVPPSERVRGDTLSRDELLAYRDRLLVDAQGDVIGAVAEIYCDDAGRPEWIGADTGGLLGSRRAIAPVRGSYVVGDGLSVPYTREHVRSTAAGDALTADRSNELYAHYALSRTGSRFSDEA